MAKWDTVPDGIVFGPHESIVDRARFGKQRCVYWITSHRIIVSSVGHGHRMMTALVLADCTGVRVEVRKKFMKKESWITLFSKSGLVWEDELTGKDSIQAAAWCARVSNLLADRSSH
ncbi:hypothetical protein [Sulfobacillus sp. hq2]|uniref:hypothetical protein n=1 Tax=Sulfobacillus sp. hq2 TaxID=2039167 RepID=UPI0011AF7AE4|nr:hypothetical protein [Sulfobacillus sp. hq2]